MNLDATPKCPRDEKRSAILKIAHEAFLADGYDNTSMSSIAARVGGSKATLYNYFASKEELFSAVVQDRCSELTALLSRELHDGDDLAEVLTHYGEAFVTMILSDDVIATYRMMIAVAQRFPAVGQAFYEAGPRTGAERLGAFLSAAATAGLILCDCPFTMARAFAQLCLADLHQRKLLNAEPQPTPDDIKANVKRAVTMLLSTYGLKARVKP